jgi:hypothetical protein
VLDGAGGLRLHSTVDVSRYVSFVTAQGKPAKPEAERSKSAAKNAGRVFGAVADAMILTAVLLFSAITVIVIALGAPLVLGVSAIAGAFPRIWSGAKRARGGWREAHVS